MFLMLKISVKLVKTTSQLSLLQIFAMQKEMNFQEIALKRQSCRSYDPMRDVESDKLQAVLESAVLVKPFGLAVLFMRWPFGPLGRFWPFTKPAVAH